MPPCAAWESVFPGACADAEPAVGAGQPKACGPQRANSGAGGDCHLPWRL